MEQTERHAREAGVRQRALTFDDHPVRVLGGRAHHLLRRAGDEVGDDRVDRDPLARDRDPGLAGRDERGLLTHAAQRRDDLERRGHLSDGGVGADGQYDGHALARPPMAADRQVVRRLTQLAHRRVAALRGLGEIRVAEDALVQTVPHRDAALERAREERPVLVRDPPARGGGADEQHVRPAGDRLINCPDDRHATPDADVIRRIGARTRRVDDGDDLIGRVAQHADRRLRRRRGRRGPRPGSRRVAWRSRAAQIPAESQESPVTIGRRLPRLEGDATVDDDVVDALGVAVRVLVGRRVGDTLRGRTRRGRPTRRCGSHRDPRGADASR